MSDELTFQIDGDETEPSRVVTLSRPHDGKVRVREWTSDDWINARVSERPIDDVWRDIQRAAHGRRRVSAHPGHIRDWLDGRAT